MRSLLFGQNVQEVSNRLFLIQNSANSAKTTTATDDFDGGFEEARLFSRLGDV